MAATRFELLDWLEEANSKRATFVVVMRNLNSRYDYPVEVYYEEKLSDRITTLKHERNHCIIAVYDLSKDINPQLLTPCNGVGIYF